MFSMEGADYVPFLSAPNNFHTKNLKKVLVVQKKGLPLHPQTRKQLSNAKNAEIAQLVEHNLAKVRVASSSLVFRSLIEQLFAEIAQLVEHNLAKVRVASSSLVFRSKEETLDETLAQVAEW